MKKAIALLLAIFMIAGQLPVSALAAEQAGTTIIDRSQYKFGSVDTEYGEFFSDDPFGDFFSSDEQEPFSIAAGKNAETLLASGESAQSESVTKLTIGGIDALANPSGDGWSYNAGTSILTLSGANITGDSDGYGIYAEGGSLSIILAEGTENVISAFGCGICTTDSLTITGTGSLSIKTEAVNSVGINVGNHLQLTGMSYLKLEAACGAAAYQTTIYNCQNIEILAELCGIQNFSESHLAIVQSVMKIQVTGSLEDFPPIGILAAGTVELSNTTALIEASVAGIYSESRVVISDSDIQMNCGFMGIFAMDTVLLNHCGVQIMLTLSIEEALQYMFDVLGVPPAGIFLSADNSNLTVTGETEVTVTNAMYGMCAASISLNDFSLNLQGNIYGLYTTRLTMTNGHSCNVEPDFNMFQRAAAFGYPLYEMPSGVLSYGDVTIDNCADMRISGAIAGIASAETSITIQNSTINLAEGDLYGIGAVFTNIINSNISAAARLSTDEAMSMYDFLPYAIMGAAELTLTDCYAEDGVTLGYSIENNHTFISEESGDPVTGIVIVADNSNAVTSGQCGDDAFWSLSEDGTLIVTGTGDMYNFASGTQPWINLKDQITAVSIGDSVTSVSMNAFSGCENLTSVTIGDSVTTIYDAAFMACYGLSSLQLGSGLTRIEDAAFAYSAVDSITIPEGVIHIGPMAFTSGQLESIYIPASATQIDPYFVAYSDNLRQICVHEDNPAYCSDDNGVMYNKDMTTLIQAPARLEGSYTVPASVTRICEGAFYNCRNLTIYFTGNMPVMEELAFDGVNITVCYPVCNDTWTEDARDAIDANINWVSQHCYEATVVSATCQTEGYTQYTCSGCGDSYTADKVDALGHDYADGTCIRCGEQDESYKDYTITYTQASISLAGDIGLNYYATLSEDLMADENAYMVFTVAGEDQMVPISEAIVSGNQTYRFSCAVPARMMSEEVVGQMYASDGTAVGEAKAFSVKAYCDKAIAAYSSYAQYENLVNLMKAMLNYGGYSQIQLGYNTDNLANADLADTSLPAITGADLAAYAHGMEGSEPGISIKSVSLLLQSTTTIRYYFQLDGSHPIEEYTFIVDGEVVEPVLYSGSTYYVDKVGVPARDLDVNSYVEVGGLTVWYSGMSYVRQILNSSNDTNLINVCKALYAYSEAANAYFK